MDDADVDNGCMSFIPGSHKKPMREHRPAAPGVHVLMCDGTEVGIPHIWSKHITLGNLENLSCALQL